MPAATAATIAQHDDKVLLTYNNAAYLVPLDFIAREHPGGKDIVMQYAGRDVTKAFDTAGHSLDAVEMLQEWRAEVPAEERAALQERALRRQREEQEWRWRSTFIAAATASVIAAFILSR